MNILIVEDDAVQGRFVERCLSEHVEYGSLTVVRAAEDALQTLGTDAALDVLIVDWMLPGMDASGHERDRSRSGRTEPRGV